MRYNTLDNLEMLSLKNMSKGKNKKLCYLIKIKSQSGN